VTAASDAFVGATARRQTSIFAGARPSSC